MQILDSHRIKRLTGGLAFSDACALSNSSNGLGAGRPTIPHSDRTRSCCRRRQRSAGPGCGVGTSLFGRFQFQGCQAGWLGRPLLCADDKTPLKFHFEKYDPQNDVALAWVAVPDLGKPDGAAVYMYYGAKDAPAGGQDRVGTYDADTLLVWHFAGDGAPQDASGKNSAGSGSVARDPGGLIGPAAKFDGTNHGWSADHRKYCCGVSR